MKNIKKRAPNLDCFLVLAIFLIVCLQVKGRTLNEVGRITGEVTINLREEKLIANLKYDYIATEETESSVKFYLNRNFNVKKVKCRSCTSFNFESPANSRPTLLINLKKPLQKGARLPINIEYEGDIEEIYKSEHEFLELGLDNFWFPIHPSIGQFNFFYNVSIKTDVPDFQLVSNGRTTKKGKSWIIESKVPDYDIDLVLGKNLKFNTYQQDGYSIQVVSKNLPDEMPTTLLENMREILEFYNTSFKSEKPQREVTAVIRPFPEISGQGGYFRKGYFILPKYDDVKVYFFPVAHELAHYWFIGASREHAWLNESFAEYSAMLILRRKRGIEAFNEILERKKKNSANLPAIYGFDRNKNPQQSPMVLYVKGPVKLNELENMLGEIKFMEFLQTVAVSKIKETDKLIEILAQVSSRDIAETFLNKLKE
jgi:hypothetical protein